MSNYGIKVSKPGFDVKTADSADLYVDSSVPLLKIFQQGAGSQVYDGVVEGTVTNFTHNLGYNPICKIYMEVIPGGQRQLVSSSYFNSGSLFPVVHYPDSNTIQLEGTQFSTPVPAGTYNYYYYIFYDPIV